MTTFSKELLERVYTSSKMKQTSVSLKQMVMFGQKPSPLTLFHGAQFLKYELPIRLAHRVVELGNLPHDLSKMPSVQLVQDWYTQSFEELHQFNESPFGIPSKYSLSQGPQKYFQPEECNAYAAELQAYNTSFVKCIDRIKKRHAPTTQKIAMGVAELKDHWKRTNSPLYPGSYNDCGSPIIPLPTAIQSFLDNFYMSRIGIRMLIGQHIAVSSPDQHPNYVGIICTKTRLADCVNDAVANAQFICQNYYDLFEAPKVKVF